MPFNSARNENGVLTALPPVDLPVRKQLPPRHSDPLLRFYHLLAVLELVHRLRVVPACSVVVPVTQDVEDPFGIDGFGQDFGGHLSELLRRTVDVLLVARSFVLIRDIPGNQYSITWFSAVMIFSTVGELNFRAMDVSFLKTAASAPTESSAVHRFDK